MSEPLVCFDCGRRFRCATYVPGPPPPPPPLCSRCSAGASPRCGRCGHHFKPTRAQEPHHKAGRRLVCPDCRHPPCETCGRGVRLPTHRFCSFACRNKSPGHRASRDEWYASKRLPPKVCPGCGDLFYKPGNQKHVYCSRACWRAVGVRRGVGSRGPNATEAGDPPPPDPGELARLCAEIRAGWPDEEREARARADWRPVPVVYDLG